MPGRLYSHDALHEGLAQDFQDVPPSYGWQPMSVHEDYQQRQIAAPKWGALRQQERLGPALDHGRKGPREAIGPLASTRWKGRSQVRASTGSGAAPDTPATGASLVALVHLTAYTP